MTPTLVSLPDPAVPLPPPFTVQEHEARKLLKQQSSRKAAGPDNVSTSILKYCANELANVFTDLFNASLNLHIVPVCFKAASTIPVRKKAKATALNDFRSVTMTSMVMKVFERKICHSCQMLLIKSQGLNYLACLPVMHWSGVVHHWRELLELLKKIF